MASSPVELQALAVPDILEASKPPSYRVVKNGEDWNSAPLAYRTVALDYSFKACQVHRPGARLTVRRMLPHFNAAALYGWEQPSSVVHAAKSLARGSARIPCNSAFPNQDPAPAKPVQVHLTALTAPGADRRAGPELSSAWLPPCRPHWSQRPRPATIPRAGQKTIGQVGEIGQHSSYRPRNPTSRGRDEAGNTWSWPALP